MKNRLSPIFFTNLVLLFILCLGLNAQPELFQSGYTTPDDSLKNSVITTINANASQGEQRTLRVTLILISIIISVFTLTYFLRVYQLKQQKILLEKLVAKKTEELYELNASKDRFFSIIAHDLKSPFNTIIGYSGILKDEIETGNPKINAEIAGIIYNSAVQTLKLLDNLLEWAKSQTDSLIFCPVPVKLSELFYEEFYLLDEMATGKNIELISSIPGNLMISADKNMIKTVLRNLISNALKFTHRNGKVEISASIKSGNVEIAISDNGIGMTKEVLDKLFRIDGNLSNNGTENEKGTGLGLFLCKEFVEKHNGTIWAESEAGKGSVFRFTLPLDVPDPS